MPNLYTTLPTGAYVGTQSMVLTLSPDIAKADISLMFDGEWVQHIVAQYTGSPVTVVLDKPGVCSITAIPRLLSNGDVPVGPMYPIIDASTNTVYSFLDGVIKAIPGLKAQDFFGSPRLVDSYVEPGPIVTYLIDTDNQIKPQ